MRPIESYRLGWRSLSFLEKHAVIGTVFTVLLALGEVALAVIVFRVTGSLQAQANYLQQAQFRIEENGRNAERARAATRAFGIESMHPSPGSERIVPASGSQGR